MRTRQHAGLALITALLLAASGCGGGSSSVTTPSAKPYFLYTVTIPTPSSNLVSNLVSLKIDGSTGAASVTSNISLSQLAPGLAVNGQAKTLYLSSSSISGIGLFSVDPNSGVPTSSGFYNLTAICPFCSPQSVPGQLALSPSEKFLYYGSATLGASVSEAVGALGVDSSTGALSQVTGSPFLVPDAPFAVAVHPSGKFVYTGNIDKTGANFIFLQSINAFSVDPITGALTPAPGSPFTPPLNAAPAGLAVDPSGKFLYLSTGLAANGILGWSIDSTTGAITALPGSPFQPGGVTAGSAFDPSGKFLYVSAGSAGGLLGFSVDPVSGNLTPLASSPFASPSLLGAPIIDPDGRFLFTADFTNNAIVGFKLDSASGALTSLGTPTVIGAHAAFMAIIKAP